MHFWNDGNIDGTFDLYYIDPDLLRTLPTYEGNKQEGKRPHVRLLEDLICKKGIKPLATITPW